MRPHKPLLLLGFLFIALVFALFYNVPFNVTSRTRDGSTLQQARQAGNRNEEATNERLASLGQRQEAKVPESFVDVLNDFGLYLRMYYGKRDVYLNILVPSMKYFWFIPVNLTVVLDDTPEDRKFGEEISNIFPFPTICYDAKFDPKYYDNKGYKLQQLSMFYAEKCFDKKYVGFVDTDSLFVTSTTPELMFNGAKPIVLGQYGQTLFRWWRGTSFALGKKEVFTCMTYFPVVMKVEHLIALRRYVAELHNTSFVNVFRKFSKGNQNFSQFSIMCNYMWYFHHDEYQFHAMIRSPTEPWNNTLNARGRQ